MNRYIFGVIGLIALVFALVTVNHGISTNAQPDSDDDQQQQSQQQNNTQQAAPKQAATPAAAGSASAAQAPPDEVTVGDPSKAKYKIVVGWQYDSKNQSDPSKVNESLQTLQQMAEQSGGKISVQAADVDVPDDTRSPQVRGIHDVGVMVNGKPLIDSNLGEGNGTPAAVAQAVKPLAVGH